VRELSNCRWPPRDAIEHSLRLCGDLDQAARAGLNSIRMYADRSAFEIPAVAVGHAQHPPASGRRVPTTVANRQTTPYAGRTSSISS
jgi:hypothetical protein